MTKTFCDACDKQMKLPGINTLRPTLSAGDTTVRLSVEIFPTGVDICESCLSAAFERADKRLIAERGNAC